MSTQFVRQLSCFDYGIISLQVTGLHNILLASIRSGDDIKTVRENLGHATAAFTLDVYGHVTERMKKESKDRMEQFLRQ